MSNNLGLGVMIKFLSGNADTVAAYKAAIGKRIAAVELDKAQNELRLRFDDGTGIVFSDGGQSCCEHRYMTCDDDLTEFTDTKFIEAELADAPNEQDEYGEHEVQFLRIKTEKGIVTVANHNEHNGYYGGFWIEIAPMEEQ